MGYGYGISVQSYTIVFTELAIQDLQKIRDYIGKKNPSAASRVAIQIIAACDRLEYLPERGRPGIVTGTREIMSCWPYAIVYRIINQNVEILRVWHMAQNR